MQRKIEDIEKKTQATLAAIDSFKTEYKLIEENKENDDAKKETLCESLLNKTIDTLNSNRITHEETTQLAASAKESKPETRDIDGMKAHIDLLNRAYNAVTKAAKVNKLSREFLLLTFLAVTQPTAIALVSVSEASASAAPSIRIVSMFRPENQSPAASASSSATPAGAEKAKEEEPNKGLRK